MDTLTKLLVKYERGAIVWLSPEDLGVQLETFDAKARVWEREGGADTFTYLGDHRESQTGGRLIDRVKIRYDGPTDESS